MHEEEQAETTQPHVSKTVRYPLDVWNEAVAFLAARPHDDFSDLSRRALRAYVRKHRRQQGAAQKNTQGAAR